MSNPEPASEPNGPRKNGTPGFHPDGTPIGVSRQVRDRLLRCIGRSNSDPTKQRLPGRVCTSTVMWTELSRRVGGDLFENPDKLWTLQAIDRLTGRDVSWEDFSNRVVAAITSIERSRAQAAEMARQVNAKERDPLADPREAIRQWILDARLAGGVSGGPDMVHAKRSVDLLLGTLRIGEPGGPTDTFFHMGCCYVWAYMMAMANRPREDFTIVDMRSHLTQAHLGAMAAGEPERGVRFELEKAAACDERLFSTAMTTLGL